MIVINLSPSIRDHNDSPLSSMTSRAGKLRQA